MMRCSNMAADSKTEKKLGHNLTVKGAVLLPNTLLPTTTVRYNCKVHTFDRAGGVGRRPGAL